MAGTGLHLLPFSILLCKVARLSEIYVDTYKRAYLINILSCILTTFVYIIIRISMFFQLIRFTEFGAPLPFSRDVDIYFPQSNLSRADLTMQALENDTGKRSKRFEGSGVAYRFNDAQEHVLTTLAVETVIHRL